MGFASINGNRNQANNYTLDGADQNEPQNNLIAYNPAPEALSEVRVYFRQCACFLWKREWRGGGFHPQVRDQQFPRRGVWRGRELQP